MVFYEGPPNNGDYDNPMAEHEQRGKAIIAAHQKMIEAVHIHTVLGSVGREGTHRHIQFLTRDLGYGEMSFIKFSIVPKRSPVSGESLSNIDFLSFEMPIKPWEKADEFMQNMHLLSLNEYRDTLERSAKATLNEPLFAPDQVLLFSAYRGSDSIHGLIGESSYGAIEFMSDILPTPIGVDGGLDYSIAVNEHTHEEKMRLEADWFPNIESFTDLIGKCEPTTVDGRYQFGNAA